MKFKFAPPEEQKNYTYSYGIDGFAEVSDDVYNAVVAEINGGSWQEFDEETWMK